MNKKTLSVQELVEIHSLSTTNEESESSQTAKEAEQMDCVQFEKETHNLDVLGLLTSFQEMCAEEQRLLEVKKQLSAKQLDLQTKLTKEIENTRISVANLMSEIPILQNKTLQLEQALELTICNKPQATVVTPIPLKTTVSNVVPQCNGLLNCSKPENCAAYELCLKKYLTAEIRNEVIRF
jgi:hypothetical protein